MPQIQAYESQVGPQGEINTKAASGAGISLGQGVQALGEGVSGLGAGVEEHDIRIESGKVYSESSAAHADMLEQIKNLTDPMDKDGRDKIFQDYQDRMDKLRSSITTGGASAVFERTYAQDKQSLMEGFAAKNAALTGKMQVQDFKNTLQNNSRVVFNQNDPKTFLEKIQAMREATLKMTGDNAPEREALFRGAAKELVEANFKSQLIANPKNAKKLLIDDKLYDEYIDGTDKGKLLELANTHEKAKEADSTRELENNIKIRRLNSEIAADKYFDEAMEGKPVADKILMDSSMNYTERLKVINAINSVQKTTNKMEATNITNDLTQRILSSPNDPNHISSLAEINAAMPKISFADRKNLAQLLDTQLKLKGTPEGQLFTAFSETAALMKRPDKLTGAVDPLGPEKYANAMVAAQQKIEEYKKKGLPVSTLFDSKNPDSVYRLITPSTRSEQRQNMRNFQKGTIGAPGAPGQRVAPKLPPPKDLNEVTKRLKDAGF